jgi:hypothetical protein
MGLERALREDSTTRKRCAFQLGRTLRYVLGNVYVNQNYIRENTCKRLELILTIMRPSRYSTGTSIYSPPPAATWDHRSHHLLLFDSCTLLFRYRRDISLD